LPPALPPVLTPSLSPSSQAAPKAEAKDEEPAADGLDVYLALINGVVGRNKELKYDNGALQYFFGVPPKGADAKARDVMSIQSQQSGK
jgi:hypothetical protein